MLISYWRLQKNKLKRSRKRSRLYGVHSIASIKSAIALLARLTKRIISGIPAVRLLANVLSKQLSERGSYTDPYKTMTNTRTDTSLSQNVAKRFSGKSVVKGVSKNARSRLMGSFSIGTRFQLVLIKNVVVIDIAQTDIDIDRQRISIGKTDINQHGLFMPFELCRDRATQKNYLFDEVAELVG